MDMIIVWFNGPSRQKLIDKFPIQPHEIGCNHIRRDRAVQHVCVFDKILFKEIPHEKGVHYYTHPAWAKQPWIPVEHPRAHPLNSGTLAILLANKLCADPIYILGCDWGITRDSVYDYQRKEQTKYGNLCKKVFNIIAQEHTVTVVHDAKPDVDQHIITTSQFLDLIVNK